MIARCVFDFVFRLPFGVWVASDGDIGFLFLGLPFGITLFSDFSERKVIAAGDV